MAHRYLFLLLVAASSTCAAQNPLAIPPELDLDTFDLVVDEHTHEFYPGFVTNTYGASAEYLGPTLILHRGDTTRIRVHNQLDQITSMHWHGMHVPGDMDGGPQRIIDPGDTWMAEYLVKNPAATYWYHPHPHQLTAEQANFGVAGLIIVRDEDEAQLPLPRTYGVDDFPVVIQDRKFEANGDFAFYPFGDSVLVNGTPNAFLECPAQVVRLRLLNGSNARIYALGIEGQSMHVITNDGGLLPGPAAVDRLWLSNGERAEVLLDLTGMEGDSLLLVSHGEELPSTVPGSSNLVWESSSLNGVAFPVLRIRVVVPTVEAVTGIPATLLDIPMPVEAESIPTRTKTITGMGMVGMGMFMIDGLMFDMDVVNDTMQLGTVEVWNIVNNSNMAHPMHIHGVSFTVLERNGQPPPVWEQGPKDVVLVDRFETVKLIMRYGEPSNGYPYMYHCHNLMHEDNMMMLQYIVLDPSLGITAEPAEPVILFPSPAIGSVRYDIGHGVDRVVVRDARGRTLLESPRTGTTSGVIELDGIPAGMLVVELSGDGRSTRTRLMKQ